MALTRKFLSALGIEADKIDEIIEAHTDSINALKEQRDSYKADAEKLPEVQKELDGLKAKGTDGFEKKYNDLKAEYDNYKKDVTAKEERAKKEEAYKEILKDAGIGSKYYAKVLKYTDWDSVKLDADGKIEEAKQHIKDVRSEWSELIVSEGKKGADTDTPPAGSGNGGSRTKEEIMKISDPAERQKAIAENHEIFGF